MRKLVKLVKDENLTYELGITRYEDPEFIYLPIYKNFKLLVKENETVLKGQAVLEKNLNKIRSSVSGVVKGITEKNLLGQKEKFLVIQNDYKEKEKSSNYKKRIKYDASFITSTLYEFGFFYLANYFETKKIKNLVINGVEDEPYIVTSSYILNHYAKEILEMADILSSSFKIPSVLIASKSTDTRNIELLLSQMGTYPKISLSLIEDKYLLGNPFFLTEYLNLNNPNTLVLDAKTICEMYMAIKYGKYNLNTFFTVCGPVINKSKVFEIKKGTSLKELLSQVEIKNYDCDYLMGGLMTGNKIDPYQEVIYENAKGLVVIPRCSDTEKECIRCGQCAKICPVKVNPRNLKDRNLMSKNCIDCGLCSYICPSHINLRKYLRGEDE